MDLFVLHIVKMIFLIIQANQQLCHVGEKLDFFLHKVHDIIESN
jgi:hypothetical protein